jgi:hypothetical protein
MSWLDTALRRQPNEATATADTESERADNEADRQRERAARKRADNEDRRQEERAERNARRREAAAERADDEERRQQERVERDTRRREAVARRRQVAGQLASAALSWSANGRIEGGMWFCLFGGLIVLYIGSYTDLAATFGAFGYDGRISWLMPLGIDLPVTASVLAQMLAGRWKCNWWVRVRLGLLTTVIAPLTLAGNALRGAIDNHGHFTFHVDLWMDLVAFAVPGLGVVLIGYVASMMQGERAELTRQLLEAEAHGGVSTDDSTAPASQPANVPAESPAYDEAPGDNPADEADTAGNPPADEPTEPGGRRAAGDAPDVRNPQPRQPARVEVRRLLSRHHGALTDDELHKLAVRVHERTGVSIPHARRLLRDEQQPRLVTDDPQSTRTPAEAER